MKIVAFKCLSVFALAAGLSGSALGAKLTFTGPTAFTTDAALNQAGTVLVAANFTGAAQSVTPSGGSAINFATGTTGAPNTSGLNIDVSTTAGGTVGTGNQTFYTNGGITSGNANFNTVLNSGAFDGAPNVVTINGLTIGVLYQVQVFVDDTRGCCSGRTVTFSNTDGTNTTAPATEGTPSYFIGSFTADAAKQAFQENAAAGNVNAVVVRAVPEPASLALLGLGSLALLRRRRRH